MSPATRKIVASCQLGGDSASHRFASDEDPVLRLLSCCSFLTAASKHASRTSARSGIRRFASMYGKLKVRTLIPRWASPYAKSRMNGLFCPPRPREPGRNRRSDEFRPRRRRRR